MSNHLTWTVENKKVGKLTYNHSNPNVTETNDPLFWLGKLKSNIISLEKKCHIWMLPSFYKGKINKKTKSTKCHFHNK